MSFIQLIFSKVLQLVERVEVIMKKINYMIIYPNFTKFTQIFFKAFDNVGCCVEAMGGV